MLLGVSNKHSNPRDRLAGYVGLQNLETDLAAAACSRFTPLWILEVAPMVSASPGLEAARSRMLLDETGVCWPFRAAHECWPLEDESVPALLLRHLWQPAICVDMLEEAVRVLRPGGFVVSISANPWHRQAWRETGPSALRLPAWPQFQWLHYRLGLQLQAPIMTHLRGMVPGLAPLLVLVSRKRSQLARVSPERWRPASVAAGRPAIASHCKAA